MLVAMQGKGAIFFLDFLDLDQYSLDTRHSILDTRYSILDAYATVKDIANLYYRLLLEFTELLAKTL